MDTLTTARPTSRWAPAATLVLFATLLGQIGATWDIQWHSDVGPDTFFTVPHLLLYSSAAISGFTSLAVVLATTAAQRAGRPVDEAVGGRSVRVLGRTFAAPIGYLVTGVGSASFLLYGLWDLWWHSLYGFDAVIDSPPHIGLFLSSAVSMIGAVMVFAAARTRRWAAVGALAALAVLLDSNTITVLALEGVSNGVVTWTRVGTGVLTLLVLMAAAGFLRRPGGALLLSVIVAAMQATYWWFSPWAARAYADAVGLPLRDFTEAYPVTPSLIPMCLVPVAVIVELMLLRAHHRWLVAAAAGVGAAIVAACAAYQIRLVFGAPLPDTTSLAATTFAALVIGLAAGPIGWRLGDMLRHLAPDNGKA